jgi:pyruvate,orthophosphate dikinase
MPNVYLFDESEPDRFDQGNKGANLIRMTEIGLPVPPGFIISISAWREYQKTGKLPVDDIKHALARLEEKMGRKLGEGLMVSVRSSGPVSMPGMMDTVLNVDDFETIEESTKQVFDSWNGDRAIQYRRLNGIPGDLGTSSIIQAMVMGNADENSGTGVVFTRNGNTGEPGLFGEYLNMAQGEDIVSGTRTPVPIAEMEKEMPEQYKELQALCDQLETHFKDMQDIEYTVETGKLYLLQTRNGKRTPLAAVQIAMDMLKEGLIDEKEVLLRVQPDELRLLLPKGLAAAPGAAIGKAAFTVSDSVAMTEAGEDVILVRPETTPDDILGISVSKAVLTIAGGLTSHAAIVTRAMGKPCICGAGDAELDLEKNELRVGSKVVRKGDVITVDGTSGCVFEGSLPLVDAELGGPVAELLTLTDKYRRLGVRANADTAAGMVDARAFGAEGIGLCRTERQFNAPDRLELIRAFILAETPDDRKVAIKNLHTLAKQDFIDIFRALDGLPIIIRLLDLPLHEFLPPKEEITDPKMLARVEELAEINPMMGHRGVRVGITSPDLYQMQVQAIAEAKAEVANANPSIMIPQVIAVEEFLFVKKWINDPTIKVGIMVETVRAAIQAPEMAEVVDFFSFGTNDLTQATLSFSREDAEQTFLQAYLDNDILADNPFQTLDVDGVGRVVELAVKAGKGANGGDPASVKFFHKAGLDYVSASPFRVPLARLAAAQVVLEEEGN